MKPPNSKKFYSPIKKFLYLLLIVILGVLSTIYLSYLFVLNITPILPFKIKIHNKIIQQALGNMILTIAYSDNESIFLAGTVLFFIAIMLEIFKSRSKQKQA